MKINEERFMCASTDEQALLAAFVVGYFGGKADGLLDVFKSVPDRLSISNQIYLVSRWTDLTDKTVKAAKTAEVIFPEICKVLDEMFLEDGDDE